MIPVKIIIGYDGEKNARSARIDIREMLERWPGATPAIKAKRPTESALYIAPTTVEGDFLVWTFSAADAAIVGEGSAQIVMVNSEGTIIGKSEIMATEVMDSLDGDEGDIPEPIEGWIIQVLTAAALVHDEADRAKAEADRAEAEADRAVKEADRAEQATHNVGMAVSTAEHFAVAAIDSAAEAAEQARLAKQAADMSVDTHGLMDFQINDDGHLIYNATDSMNDIDWKLEEGRLVVSYGI